MFSLRIYAPGACDPAVFRFRYEIYVEEMGRPQIYADHKAREIRDPLDALGYNLVAFTRQGNVAGAVRMNFPKDGPCGLYESLYGFDRMTPEERNRQAFCTRGMVRASYRISLISVEFGVILWRLARSQGADSLFVDCNEPRVRFFRRMGCRPVEKAQHPEYGKVLVMRFDLDDFAYRDKVRSPLVRRDSELRDYLAQPRAAAGQGLTILSAPDGTAMPLAGVAGAS